MNNKELDDAAEKIYVASKTKHAYRWKALRDWGYNIISTWIDEAGEGQSADLNDLQQRCINESLACDLMIVYAEKEDYLKGAFIEMGVALSANKRIYLIGEVLPNGSAFTHNKNVYHIETFESAVEHYKANKQNQQTFL